VSLLSDGKNQKQVKLGEWQTAEQGGNVSTIEDMAAVREAR